MKEKDHLNNLPLKQIHINDPFWNHYVALVAREIIPYQYQILNDLFPDVPPSHCIRNLRIAAGVEEGTFEGFVFQDTDLAKWLEAVAYSLAYELNPALEKTADEMIELIGMAQEDSGYLDSYFTILHPGRHFCNLRDGHELYTAGHFIEAAVAYYQVTGKDEFLKIMCACAENICLVFHEKEYLHAVPGHEEIELALVKLADTTGIEKYRDMALEFVNRRGTSDYLINEHERESYIDVWSTRSPYIPEYSQSHKPVREQETAEGHAVRALYLYSAMADLAERYDDKELLRACEKLYDNITQKRMYITGGVGSSGTMERFTSDYDLPNDTAYAESCASIALAQFCRRMAKVTGEARYMDTAELALMNTVLAGAALDGKSFFYVNPLEIIPRSCIPATDKHHVMPRRQKWFGCACCPPNIARTLASLGDYMFFRNDSSLWVNLFISGSCETAFGDVPAQIRIESKLPYEGDVCIDVMTAGKGALKLRLPEYAENPNVLVEDKPIIPDVKKGYISVPIHGTTTIKYSFDMPAELIYANPNVPCNAGKCAVKKGPLVYCLEESDNGDNLAGLILEPSLPLREEWKENLLDGTLVITAEGYRLNRDSFGDVLYRNLPPSYEKTKLNFIPYCLWANREEGEMAVWIKYEPHCSF